jgi:hypothetical protein
VELLEILADGNHADHHQAVERFKMAFPRMVGIQARLYGMIVGANKECRNTGIKE